MKKSGFIVVAIFITVVAFFTLPPALHYLARQKEIADRNDVEIPDVTVASSAAGLMSSVNWPVPFTSQAPTGNWDPPFDEACEEASVLMVLRYFSGEPLTDAETEIRALTELNASLGFPIDTTAAQVKTLIEGIDPSLRISLIRNPTVEDLKLAMSEGSLIIVPAAGRILRNPYFRSPGPLYHMLVLRGFTKDGYVITNDPGTRRGEQFVYRWDRLIEAIHDWNGGDVENGAKVVLVVRS